MNRTWPDKKLKYLSTLRSYIYLNHLFRPTTRRTSQWVGLEHRKIMVQSVLKQGKRTELSKGIYGEKPGFFSSRCSRPALRLAAFFSASSLSRSTAWRGRQEVTPIGPDQKPWMIFSWETQSCLPDLGGSKRIDMSPVLRQTIELLMHG